MFIAEIFSSMTVPHDVNYERMRRPLPTFSNTAKQESLSLKISLVLGHNFFCWKNGSKIGDKTNNEHYLTRSK